MSDLSGWLRAASKRCIIATVLCFVCGGSFIRTSAHAATPEGNSYSMLVTLFEGWRQFLAPATREGVPDYTPAAVGRWSKELPEWQDKLSALKTDDWTVEQKNDLRLVRAEMNGLDFDLRVLRPWARDPAFYVSVYDTRSDVPRREGPVSEPEIKLYEYKWPIAGAEQKELTQRLQFIPGLLDEARGNLAGSNARDLWVYGEEELRGQVRTLEALEAGTLTVHTLGGSQHASLAGADPALKDAVRRAREATVTFIGWLEQEAPKKTGPSGVGVENYTWYQQNVHLLPWTWDEEVTLLRRELERAQASLRLEEHNNRKLPQLEPVKNAAEYDRLANTHLEKFVSFLVQQEIIPDKPYIMGALRPELGQYVPEEKRVFFTRVTHREPMLLMSHQYHWIDLARMRDEPNPSPIRRVIRTSNIWDTRAEGFATAFEEIVMHAGLYDDNPRAKELVWIMLANRAARGLASLYVQANEMTLEEAGRFHSAWTPRGWAVAGDSLTGFEQLLYLRQPGYGASYVTGKILVDRLIAEYSREREMEGKPFVLREFMDRFNNEGMIPVTVMEGEMIPAAALDHPAAIQSTEPKRQP